MKLVVSTSGMDEMTEPKLLGRGDQVPHFEVRTVEGQVFSYSTIWQRKNLLLVVLPASSPESGYISDLRARESDFQNVETECVITGDGLARLPAPGVLIADRWGEIIYITAASESARSPTPEDLLGWLQYIQNRCPECEGEAR
jgi:peroxiredoxin